MSHGWSQSDKAIAKTAVERAQKRAEKEAITLFEEYRVDNIKDLWALEMKIRDWRKERQYFCVNFSTADTDLAGWMSKGWLLESDLARMSPERLQAIKAKI